MMSFAQVKVYLLTVFSRLRGLQDISFRITLCARMLVRPTVLPFQFLYLNVQCIYPIYIHEVGTSYFLYFFCACPQEASPHTINIGIAHGIQGLGV